MYKRTGIISTVVLTMMIAGIILVPTPAFAYEGHSEVIESDTIWTAGTHYIIDGVIVQSQATLTIEPGAIIKFEHEAYLTVFGKLYVNGELGNEVVFTSKDDNSYGEVIAGSDGTPSPGDWEGITMWGEGDNLGIGEFNHCRIRYGGDRHGNTWANLYFSDSDSGHFKHSISEFSERAGVRILNCSPTITDSKLIENKDGISMAGGTPFIERNTISGNSQYGLLSITSVGAENNWWGDVSGPLDDSNDTASGGLYNPDGLGDEVSDLVDYDPWLNIEPAFPIPEVSSIILMVVGLATIGCLFLLRRKSFRFR